MTRDTLVATRVMYGISLVVVVARVVHLDHGRLPRARFARLFVVDAQLRSTTVRVRVLLVAIVWHIKMRGEGSALLDQSGCTRAGGGRLADALAVEVGVDAVVGRAMLGQAVAASGAEAADELRAGVNVDAPVRL